MNIVTNNKIVLDQLIHALKQLSNKQYSLPLEIYSNASIGQHTRHILEFYDLLLNCNSIICYDKRNRDQIFEKNVDKTIVRLNEIVASLNDLNLKTILNIESDILNIKTSTTIERELLYTLDHTIHHMAIIKIGLITNFDFVDFDANFGVAPSTIEYKKQCVQ